MPDIRPLGRVPPLLLCLLLAACAAPRTTVKPEPAPEPAPAVSTPRSVPPRPTVVEAVNEGEQRARRLRELAASPRAMAGSEQGYYLDVLYARLRQQLGSEAPVHRSEQGIRIVLPPTVSFESGSAELSAAAVEALDRWLAPLADYQSLLISVHGHTDATGPAAANQRLSAQRAQRVAQKLQALGQPARHLLAIGHGADQPIADNDSPEGRERNRRVELLLEPIVATTP